MTALATLEELKDRLDWELDADEERVGTAALDDASELARFYGKSSWTTTQTAPPYAKTLVLRACARHLQNPNGYTQSRAGDETLTWSDRDPELGIVHFTDTEIKQLERLAGKHAPAFGSVTVLAYGTDPRLYRRRRGLVPVDYDGKPFPLCADQHDDDPGYRSCR